MFCTRCGRETAPEATFCPACGTALREVPAMPAPRRVAGHLRLLGICWIALSAFRLLPGVVLLGLVDYGVFRAHGAPPFVVSVLEGLAAIFLIFAGAGLLAGWGLLAKQPWARMLAIILGTVGLVDMPFGTALGIYTLWALLPADSEAEFRQITNSEYTARYGG